MSILKTERLILRELTLTDAPFILILVNEPSWLENIGDKNVHNLQQAEDFLQQGPIKSYQINQFGLYMVELKSTQQPIGVCGLVKREGLDCPDVGYALMPEFWGLGLASEAAKASIEYAHESLNISRIVGVTNPENVSSMRVLEKIGLKFDKKINLPGYEEPSCLFV